MSDGKNRARIEYLFQTYTPDISALEVCYRLIESAPAEEKAELLKRTIICYDKGKVIDEHLQPRFMSRAEEQKLIAQHGRRVDKFFVGMIQQNPTEEEFYARLWEYLSTDPRLPDHKSRVAALLNCCIDKRLPYAQIDIERQLSMTDDDIHICLDRIGEERLIRLNSILNRDFDQYTEQSSLIVDMLEEMPGRVEKTVLLSQLLHSFQKELRMLQFHCSRLMSELSD